VSLECALGFGDIADLVTAETCTTDIAAVTE